MEFHFERLLQPWSVRSGPLAQPLAAALASAPAYGLGSIDSGSPQTLIQQRQQKEIALSARCSPRDDRPRKRTLNLIPEAWGLQYKGRMDRVRRGLGTRPPPPI